MYCTSGRARELPSLKECHSSAQTASEGRIIAGLENNQQVFLVPIAALERSAVIKGYIDEPDSMPESLRKDGALYLPHCDPEVVRTLIHCLRRDDYSSSDYEFDLNLRSQDPLFYIKTYKLALTLACVLAIKVYNSQLIFAST